MAINRNENSTNNNNGFDIRRSMYPDYYYERSNEFDYSQGMLPDYYDTDNYYENISVKTSGESEIDIENEIEHLSKVEYYDYKAYRELMAKSKNRTLEQEGQFDDRIVILYELDDCNNKLSKIDELEEWNNNNRLLTKNGKKERREILHSLKEEYKSIKKDLNSLYMKNLSQIYNDYAVTDYAIRGAFDSKKNIDSKYSKATKKFPKQLFRDEPEDRLTRKNLEELVNKSATSLSDALNSVYKTNNWAGYNNYVNKQIDAIYNRANAIIYSYDNLTEAITRCNNIENNAGLYIEMANSLKSRGELSKKEISAVNKVINYMERLQAESKNKRKEYVDVKIDLGNIAKVYDINDESFDYFINYKTDINNERDSLNYINENINTLTEYDSLTDVELENIHNEPQKSNLKINDNKKVDSKKGVSFAGTKSLAFDKNSPPKDLETGAKIMNDIYDEPSSSSTRLTKPEKRVNKNSKRVQEH